MHPSGHVDSGSGVRRPFTIKLSTDALESLGHRIIFIDNWIQRFSVNDEFRTFLYKDNMLQLFKEINLSLPIKIPMIIKNNIRRKSTKQGGVGLLRR